MNLNEHIPLYIFASNMEIIYDLNHRYKCEDNSS